MITENNDKVPSFWIPHIEKKLSSGMSRVDYCRINALNKHKMAYWEQRLSSDKAAKKLPSPLGKVKEPFAKAVLGPLPAIVKGSEDVVRLVLGNELSLEFGPSVRAIWLADLIRAMRNV